MAMDKFNASAFSDKKFVNALQELAEVAKNINSTAVRVVKNALNGGEISPLMAARFDQPRYQNGCHLLQNMVVLPTGGVKMRPYLGKVADLPASVGGISVSKYRLLPFVFSANESRMLVICAGANSSRLMVYDTTGSLMGTAANKDGNPLALPFTADNLGKGTFTQSADVIYYAHPDCPPGKIMRYADTEWELAEIQYTPGLAAPKLSISYSGKDEPGMAGTRYYYVVTSINEETGEESPASEPIFRWSRTLSSTNINIITIKHVEGASEYRVYKQKGSVYGFIGRVAASETGADVTFRDANIAADVEDTPPEYKNPFAPATDANGEIDTTKPKNYPSVVFLHQQRLGYAASSAKPMTIWMSQSGNYESMAASIPPADDDAIEVTLAASQANRILWCVSDRDGLTVGTQGGEWMLTGNEGAAVTPKDVMFKPQTNHGSAEGVQPIKCNTGIIFCQRGGRILREISYSFQSDSYNAINLSLMAEHLTEKNAITHMVWQPEPDSIVWCLKDDGQMLGLTYMRDHELCAWHRHIFGAQSNNVVARFAVADLASIPNANGKWEVFAISGRQLCIFGRGTFLESSLLGICRPIIPEPGRDTMGLLRKVNAVKFRVLNTNAGHDPVIYVSSTGAARGGYLKAWQTQGYQMLQIPFYMQDCPYAFDLTYICTSRPSVGAGGTGIAMESYDSGAGRWQENAGIEFALGLSSTVMLGMTFAMELSPNIGTMWG